LEKPKLALLYVAITSITHQYAMTAVNGYDNRKRISPTNGRGVLYCTHKGDEYSEELMLSPMMGNQFTIWGFEQLNILGGSPPLSTYKEKDNDDYII
jgi:hypothetical protein